MTSTSEMVRGADVSWNRTPCGDEEPYGVVFEGSHIPQYLIAIHRSDGYQPAVEEDEAMATAIDVLNNEMVAAGIRIFVGGLHSVLKARSLRAQPDGGVLVTEGPYLTTKEHVGGIWVLDVASLDDALNWAKKAVIACRASVEARPFH